jgi:hypothetical protein
MRRLLTRACAVFVLTLAACGPASRGADDDGSDDDDDDQPAIDAPVSNPTDGTPIEEGDASCGAQNTPIEVENLGDPPDLLIVLDRSGSMSSPIPMFPPNFTSKWMIMRDALNALSAEFDDNIRLGLAEFPTNDDCAADAGAAVRVPIDLGQAPEIMQYFATRSPNGNTPAMLGLQAALTYYNSIAANPAGRYVLFATDGEPNCAADAATASAQTVAAVQALAAAGIKTYVLGFGGGFVDDSVLNMSALAGQVPRAGGPPHYYAANNATELQNVLDQIAGGIIVPSCSYALASAPPVPDDVTVTLDGVVVPRSTQHTNGWDYYPDAMTITFFGTYCDQISSGAVANVSFVYGCPGPVID